MVLRLLGLAAALAAMNGCALVGGTGGDFGPFEGTSAETGAGGGAAPSCVDGTRDGDETDVDCGGPTCGGCAEGAACDEDSDCASSYCTSGTCKAPTCSDGDENGAETDVDCGGGACAACKDGKSCARPSDCASESCVTGTCLPPSCSDGVQNGDETNVDCGPTCPCGAGQPCVVGSDCMSTICAGGVCTASTCLDATTNGTETDVDCGGEACPLCADFGICAEGSDCASGVCATNKCQPPSCSDATKNQGETGVDCGPVCAAACPDGEGCGADADCSSLHCVSGVCAPDTCGDGIQNGAETLVDCGGGCPCDPGQPCATGAGCKSKVCAGSVCQAPSCADGVENGAETDVDCGGTCSACAVGKACSDGGDCLEAVCSGGTCSAPTCSDGEINGAETDVDCGGPACASCGPGSGCSTAADCTGGLCAGNVCASTCSDGVKNQGESAIDCGGPMCAACAVGKACLGDADCASHYCKNASCAAPTCNDGHKDGGESDVDCGGPACPTCDNGKGCVFAEDCTSGGCNAGTCGPWVKAFGLGPVGVSGLLATDPEGSVINSASFMGSINFGGGPISPNGGWGYLVKYTRTGAHVFSKPLGATPAALAADAAGDVFVAAFHSPPTSGCYAGLPTNGGGDIGLAKHSPVGGCLWAQHYGGVDYDDAERLAAFPNGDVVLQGRFNSPSMTLGATTLTNAQPAPPGGTGPYFVARIAGADGTPLWAKSSGSPFPIDFGGRSSIAVDAQGDVIFAGMFAATMDFGAPCPILSGDSNGNAFVVKLSGIDGSCLWAKSFGYVFTGDWAWATVDAAGDVLVAGNVDWSVDLGGGQLGGGGWGGFVAKFSGADGSYEWAHAIPAWPGGPPASDAAGDMIVPCTAAGPIDFGGGLLPFAGVNDACVAKYSGVDGSYQFAKVFGASGNDFSQAVAVNPVTESVLLEGLFEQTIDFGTGPMTAPDPTSIFLLSMGPLP